MGCDKCLWKGTIRENFNGAKVAAAHANAVLLSSSHCSKPTWAFSLRFFNLNFRFSWQI